MSSERISLWDLSRSDGPAAESGINFEFVASANCLREQMVAAPMQFLFLRHLLQSEGVEIPGLPGSLLVMDEADLPALEKMSTGEREELFRRFRDSGVAGAFLCNSAVPPSDVASICEALGFPLLRVPHSAKILVDNLLELFHVLTVSSRTIHGNMMDVYGLGLLIIGKSGIGKSECCLDLITKGHRLVADDSVRLYKNRHGHITATASRSVAAAWMEIRGVGIIDVDLLYGVSALRTRKDVDLVIELMDWEDWQATKDMDETGRLNDEDLKRLDSLNRSGQSDVQQAASDSPTMDMFGVQVPLVQIPVGPGRSIANLVEVSAKKHLLALARKREHGQPKNWGSTT